MIIPLHLLSLVNYIDIPKKMERTTPVSDQGQKQLLDLPVEVLHLIICELDSWSILQLSKTCLSFQKTVDSFKTTHRSKWRHIVEEEDRRQMQEIYDDEDDWDQEPAEDDDLDYLEAYNDEIPSFGSNYNEDADDEFNN